MENIYGQTEAERNSIAEIPSGLSEKAGDTLYSWLGSIWRGAHKGDGMVRGIQKARGIRIAQMAVDIAEASMMKNRRRVPVFHRELWRPVTVRLSQRDRSQENMLSIGGEAVIGAQTSEDPYGVGTVLEIGKLGAYRNYVTYPVGDEIAGGALTIVDNIVNPTVRLERDVDFVIRGGSIIFPRENDPLADGSSFDRIDIPGVIDDGGASVPDMKAVLWASDVLVDRDYIAGHLSYEIGANAPSTDLAKRIVNAALDAVSCGLTPEIARTLIAAMLNVPVIQEDSETVIGIAPGEDGTVVTTDKGEYRISPKAKLLGSVSSGATLRRGDLLDGSFKIYSGANSILSDNGLADEFMKDIPSVVLPSQMLRASTEHGVYAMWGKSMVKKAKSSGGGGTQRLYFDIGGTDADVSAFWESVWESADESGVEMSDLIGEEGSEISPASFVVRNFVGANTMFVVVDRSQIDDDSMMRDPMFFGMLSDVVPSSMRIFLVEHSPVSGDVSDIGDADEASAAYASVPVASDVAGGRSESVSVRLVRPSPAKVGRRKEEEI